MRFLRIRLTDGFTVFRRSFVLLPLLVAGCGGNRNAIPANVTNPDRFLYDRGTAALKERKWTDAREYFRQVVDNYPNSPHRPDAKLGMGDTYLGEKTAESLVLSANEYREFLTFYPTNPRADYAQYKLAMTHFEQMRAPERDQTETQAALREFQIFFDRYPMSPLIDEVRMKWREARDRLSRAEFRVGYPLLPHSSGIPGAIPRFRQVLSDDPIFGGRDEVYFYLAESLARTDKKAEAIPYFERLLTEFEASEHIEEAKRRLEELKTQTQTHSGGRQRVRPGRLGETDDVENSCGRRRGGHAGRRHGRRRSAARPPPPPICPLKCWHWRARPRPLSKQPDTPLRITGGQDASVRHEPRARRPHHDQRRQPERHRGRAGVLHAPDPDRESREDHARHAGDGASPPAGFACGPWTTRCRSRRSRTRARRSTSATTSSRSRFRRYPTFVATSRSRSATTTGTS